MPTEARHLLGTLHSFINWLYLRHRIHCDKRSEQKGKLCNVYTNTKARTALTMNSLTTELVQPQGNFDVTGTQLQGHSEKWNNVL